MSEDDAAATDREKNPRPLRTDLRPIVEAVRDADAAAFVAVGDRFDGDLRYLSRFAGPDRPSALVVVPTGEATADTVGRAVLCAPALFGEQAEREFVASARASHESGSGGPTDDEVGFHDGVAREVRTERVGDHAGERAAAAAADLAGGASGDGEGVLTPASIPHDAAVYLERAGFEPASTEAVATARARKTPAERDRIRRVQRATVAGIARAEAVLADCEAVDEGSEETAAGRADDDRRPPLRWDGEPLTTERLRREVNAALAARGVRDAGNTVIGAGPSAADLHYVGDDPVRPGEAVLLDVSPRGPDGYYGDATRTFVVDGDGGWERRAYVAVEAAREAALDEVEPGVPAKTVHGEAAAELAAYGFDPNAGEGEAGFTHGTGHGVGVSLHERPSLSGAGELRPGHVVTVEPGVYDPDIGGVRLEDLVLVTEDGYEILAEHPFGIAPRERE
ncbi:M24 family metallopeptidase [Halorubrum ezzemoulense]|uniref:M24 family metallopeptidase n=1 Tax=Halorubrum TaxID=56688 RepID=UPI0010F599D4|nr:MULTISPECIES: M24 family metallopeptidase [Halorubrum]MDB9280387.1 M24 family metallopeptidase [Halorubrum ezzemoulense]MDB9284006.1 M24 family metallopeptidase [Halorubrum ezzemoulense]TKX66662.1 aminopeptidase P family protein [Halorubrum sp. GN12_10-3_MGM]